MSRDLNNSVTVEDILKIKPLKITIPSMRYVLLVIIKANIDYFRRQMSLLEDLVIDLKVYSC